MFICFRVLVAGMFFCSINVSSMNDEGKTLVRSVQDLAIETNDHMQEHSFHARLQQKHPAFMQENVQAYYKKIDSTTSNPSAGVDRWNFTTISIAGKQVHPDMAGVYFKEGISFNANTLEKFDPIHNAALLVMHNEQSNKLCFVKIAEKKVPVLPRFDSYKDLLDALGDNKLSLIHKVTLKGMLRVPGERPCAVIVEAENRNNQSITLSGMEFVCNHDRKVTNVFFDFFDNEGKAVELSYPIEFKHSSVVADQTVVCIKDHRMYECRGKRIYSFFDLLETRNRWVPDETGFYDLSNQVFISLPQGYGDFNDHSETIKEPVVWVFEGNHNALYQLDGVEKLEDTNDYIHSDAGSFFVTLPYRATYKDCFSHNKLELRYLVKALQPRYSIDKDEEIEEGHRAWSTGVYERVYVGDKAVWKNIEDPIDDVISFCNKDVRLDVDFSKQDLDVQQVQSYCDAAQRFFKYFSANIHCCNKAVINGLKEWNKLTRLDLSHLKFASGQQAEDLCASLGAMRQLESLRFENNYPVTDVLYPDYNEVANYALKFYCSLGDCLSKLAQLKELHIQGLWLKSRKDLGGSFCATSVNFAKMTGVINHKKQAGIRALLNSICAMGSLKRLSLDGIPNCGSSGLSRRTPEELLIGLPIWILGSPFQVVDGYLQDRALKNLVEDAAKQLAGIKSLKKIKVYTPEGNFSDYCSKKFRENLVDSSNALIVAKELQ